MKTNRVCSVLLLSLGALLARPGVAGAEGMTYGWCKGAVGAGAYYSSIWSRADDEAGKSPNETFKADVEARTGARASVECYGYESQSEAQAARDADITQARAAGRTVTVTTGDY